MVLIRGDPRTEKERQTRLHARSAAFVLWNNPICSNADDSMRRRRFFLAGRFVPCFVWYFLSLNIIALVVHNELCDFPAALPFFKRGASSVGQANPFAPLLCPIALLLSVSIFFSEWVNSTRYVLFSLAIFLPIRINNLHQMALFRVSAE